MGIKYFAGTYCLDELFIISRLECLFKNTAKHKDLTSGYIQGRDVNLF